MPEIKYAVCPGYIISPRDGDRHFITFTQICRCYGVDERECKSRNEVGFPKDFLDSLIQLYPRADGLYPQYNKGPREVGRVMGIQFCENGGTAPECPYSDFIDVANWRIGWERGTGISEFLVKSA